MKMTKLAAILLCVFWTISTRVSVQGLVWQGLDRQPVVEGNVFLQCGDATLEAKTDANGYYQIDTKDMGRRICLLWAVDPTKQAHSLYRRVILLPPRIWNVLITSVPDKVGR